VRVHGTAAVAAVLLLAGCGAAGRGPSATTAAETDESAPPAPPAAVASPAPGQQPAERPTAVRLPSGRVLPVDPISSRSDGVLAVPADIRRAGWWKGSSHIGDPFGSIVIAAHVDSFEQGVGPAAELLSARPGDPVLLTGPTRRQAYRVTSVRLVPRADLDADSVVFSAAGARRLVLITCGGPYDAARGGYRDNVVVVARPTGPGR
jgi:hypothetical protein